MRRISILLAAVACVAGVVSTAGQASARTAPSITMYTVQAAITVGDQPQFGYTTTALPTGAVVQLQRLRTDGWTTLQVIPRGAHKYTTGPALTSLGDYQYRIQAVQGSTVVARSNVHHIHAYGTVRMGALCPALIGARKCLNSHTITIGDDQLTYAMSIPTVRYSNYVLGATLPTTSCRSITMNFASEHWTTDRAWVKVVQLSGADQIGSSQLNSVAHLTASLNGGRFYLDGASTNGDIGIYIGGYASCYSGDGTR